MSVAECRIDKVDFAHRWISVHHFFNLESLSEQETRLENPVRADVTHQKGKGNWPSSFLMVTGLRVRSVIRDSSQRI